MRGNLLNGKFTEPKAFDVKIFGAVLVSDYSLKLLWRCMLGSNELSIFSSFAYIQPGMWEFISKYKLAEFESK